MRTLIRYIALKIKGLFSGPRLTETYPVTCHRCHRDIHVRPGYEGIDISRHFGTGEHKINERRSKGEKRS